jgi:FAD-dependent urate hydroxylase
MQTLGIQTRNIIIIGAGIGGLAAGIALAREGVTVRIYDRVRSLRPVGAGISLWSNGIRVINWLGLETEMAAIGGQMNHMAYRSASGDLLNAIDLGPLIETVGQRPYPVARRSLQAMLRDAYAGEVFLDHECIGIEQDEVGVTVRFANGVVETADAVIAADGVRSTLRRAVLTQTIEPSIEPSIEPNYVGYVNWNGLVARDAIDVPPDHWVIYVGQHQRASVMPVGDGQFYFFFDVPLPLGTPNLPENYRAELSHSFAGWAEPVQQLIRSMNPATVSRLEIHDFGPIDRLVKGRIALLGDAAHTTCPDLGQGGCQALEDAYVLTQCLRETQETQAAIDIPTAFQRYEQRRLDRVNQLVLKARHRAETIHGTNPAVTAAWYEQLATEKPEAVRGAIAGVILGGPIPP